MPHAEDAFEHFIIPVHRHCSPTAICYIAIGRQAMMDEKRQAFSLNWINLMNWTQASYGVGATILVCGLAVAGEPAVWMKPEPASAEITALGWDTEGTGREKTNLLRPQLMVGLRIRYAGQWRNGIDLPARLEARTRWPVLLGRVAPETEINWRVRSAGGGLTMRFGGKGCGSREGRRRGTRVRFAPG